MISHSMTLAGLLSFLVLISSASCSSLGQIGLTHWGRLAEKREKTVTIIPNATGILYAHVTVCQGQVYLDALSDINGQDAFQFDPVNEYELRAYTNLTSDVKQLNFSIKGWDIVSNSTPAHPIIYKFKTYLLESVAWRHLTLSSGNEGRVRLSEDDDKNSVNLRFSPVTYETGILEPDVLGMNVSYTYVATEDPSHFEMIIRCPETAMDGEIIPLRTTCNSNQCQAVLHLAENTFRNGTVVASVQEVRSGHTYHIPYKKVNIEGFQEAKRRHRIRAICVGVGTIVLSMACFLWICMRGQSENSELLETQAP
eukprot:TRINITY_DN2484_c0_g2_i2.p1 TRINITY_DN2484_c0_g2~~TRINITY_DN2484_c0_g2_i2.p1  ORF type:complete len:311 (+),score=20.23 TRINITY_DN2484_c0_g2_i2:143-1075(+)